MTAHAPPRIALYLNQEGRTLLSWISFMPSLGLTPRAVRAEEMTSVLSEGNCAVVMIPENSEEGLVSAWARAAGLAYDPLVLKIPVSTKGAPEGFELAMFFLNSLVDQLPNIVFVKDARTGRYLRFNRACESLLGIRCDEMVGKSDADVFPPHQAEHFRKTDLEVMANGVMVETEEEPVETRHRGTRLFHTKKIPIFASNGAPLFLLGISEDVTDLRQAELQRVQMMKEQAEVEVRENAARRMAFLAEASTLLASSLDYRRTLQKMARLAVPALADWTAAILREEKGASRLVAAVHKNAEKEVVLRELLNASFDDASDGLGIRAALQAGKSFFAPFLSQENIGELAGTPERFQALREIGCRSILLVPIVARGKNYGSFCFVSASAARTFRQEDLVVAEELGRRAGTAIDNALLYETARQAVDIRDSFLSIASHELKTPITSLKLHIQMTKRKICPDSGRAPDPAKLLDVFNRSEQQINRLSRLVDDLLDVSRIEAGRLTLFPERVNLSALVRDVRDRYREQAEGAGCEMTVEAGEDIYTTCDPFRMDQVIVNLVSNAFKYGKGHPVHLAVNRLPNAQAEIVVRDHGMGIRPERIGQIFERFERAELHAGITGLGLGLFIVRSIVEAHGGHVNVESETGKGSCFTVRMPAAEAEARAAG